MRLSIILLSLVFFAHCSAGPSPEKSTPVAEPEPAVLPGAYATQDYLSYLRGKRIGVVANHTSLVEDVHLVDTLLSLGLEVRAIFAPEHGFRGTADAGSKIKDGKDEKTNLPVYSLYGSNRKPKASQLQDIDVVVFDIQDVGVRFYTYISTMSLVMEACAEQGIPLLVLDRPNPHAHYVDGPVLEPAFSSFVGMHPVPVVYGMTMGEYATMVNAEFLPNDLHCELRVVACQHYDRTKPYSLPVRPSPNLPNDTAIHHYPSLCFFEGTVISVGRGTRQPFQLYGHPSFPSELTEISFVPKPTPGARNPKLNGQECHGFSMRDEPLETLSKIDLQPLITAYNLYEGDTDFFLSNGFINLLAGTDELRKNIEAGMTEEAIRAQWEEDLAAFRKLRANYLFEAYGPKEEKKE